jgi:hypothetical protein
VGGYQDDAKGGGSGIFGVSLGGQHHGDIHATGQVSQPFGVTGIGKAGKMKGVLVGGGGDNGVYLPAEGQLNGSFDRVSGNAAGPDGSIAIGTGVSGTQTPGAYGDPVSSG